MKKEVRLYTQQLQLRSDPDTKAWFEGYLKGAISYRGVKIPEIRKLIHWYQKEFALSERSVNDQLTFCDILMTGKNAEDKFSAILYIQNYLLDHAPASILLEFAERQFGGARLFDWSTVDWFCVRVVDPILRKNGRTATSRVEKWKNAESMWARRASIVSFRGSIQDEKVHPTILRIARKLIKEDERFIKTGVGWVLSDLSKSYPSLAHVFFEKNLKHMTREIIRRHAKYLDSQKDLLAKL